ncbi:site-specific integrase [Lacticaseibacillus saniviri]|uniref:site-specific integrase n=1 Tax=Lacticaseibacillus saniviri TaxID=931533 RepID=UPI000A73F2F7|nr:site-specific integrase [Lacticaseibacillus saniviri]
MPKYAPLPATTKQDLKIITVEQFEKILEQTPPADPFHMPLVIAFYTGMRRGEVCGLQWDMVNLDEGYIQIERQMIQKGNGVFDLESPKSAAGYRTIVIGPTLINELKEKRKSQMENRVRYGILYNENNFVCTRNNGDPILPTYIRYRSRKINDNFGIPFSFHSLRHTHATMLLEAGENLKWFKSGSAILKYQPQWILICMSQIPCAKILSYDLKILSNKKRPTNCSSATNN